MRKYFVFLLSVVIIGITGCNTKLGTVDDVTKNQESTVILQKESVQDETVPTVTEETIVTEQPTETKSIETETETETVTKTETETQKPEKKKDAPKEEPKKEQPKEEDKKKEQPQKEDAKEKEPEKPKPEEKAVGYNANNVVSLAIAKCEAGGMITTEHNLKNF